MLGATLLFTVACSSGAPEPTASPAPVTPTTPAVNIAADKLEWHFAYGTDFEDHVHEGLQTVDGGYIAIGDSAETDDSFDAGSDILVVKIDQNGKLQWSKIFGARQVRDVGYSVAETNGGYVLGVGLGESDGQKAALIGIDKQGNEVWRQTYGNRVHGGIRSIAIAPDGTIIAGGYTANPEAGFVFIAEGRGLLIRTSAGGEPIWTQNLGIPQITKVRVERGGTIALLTTVYNAENDKQNISLLKTDKFSNIRVRYTYEKTHNTQAFDFDLTNDDGFIICGHTTGLEAVNWDYILLRVDRDGQQRWVRRFGQPRGYDARYIHDESYGVRSLPDGGFVVAGGSGDEYARYSVDGHPAGSSDEWKAFTVRTDAQGNSVGQGVFGDGADQGNNAAEYLTVTKDGGYLLFVDTDSQGEPLPSNFGFMKVSIATSTDG